MRCLKCKVDLGEKYTTCPLCGEKADDVPPLLDGFETAPYPQNSPVVPMEKVKKPKVKFSFEKIKAYFNL